MKIIAERVGAQSPKAEPEEITFSSLWRQFLPLSLSDVAMTLGDPLVNTTLAHLPDARANLAAVGVAKSQAVFFESPIIMLLHASNAMAGASASRRALWRFMLLAITCLSGLVLFLCLPPVFVAVGQRLLGIDAALAQRTRGVLLLLVLWPAAIGWRRYFQGVLIRHGRGREVGRAAVARITIVATCLGGGYWYGLPGGTLAGVALIAGVVTEALFVTLMVRGQGLLFLPDSETDPKLPTDIAGVWRFYWPLANSMVVVWGGRALLVGIIARAHDGALALAAWPAAWGLVLVVANASRMVQQVIISNRRKTTDLRLLYFAASVGLGCSLILLGLAVTRSGSAAIDAFVGRDRALLEGVIPVIKLCAAIPLLVAIQNAMQGFLIGDGHTERVNASTWLGTGILLTGTTLGIKLGLAGATAAAIAMSAGLTVEAAWLCLGVNNAALEPKNGLHMR